MTFSLRWRAALDNHAVNRLHADAFNHEPFDDDWRAKVERQSIGWVTATGSNGFLGFVNVVLDGGVHAWLQDVTVAQSVQRIGVGSAIVAHAIERTKDAGREWLHVDFDADHAECYLDACGFSETRAGLVKLRAA